MGGKFHSSRMRQYFIEMNDPKAQDLLFAEIHHPQLVWHPWQRKVALNLLSLTCTYLLSAVKSEGQNSHSSNESYIKVVSPRRFHSFCIVLQGQWLIYQNKNIYISETKMIMMITFKNKPTYSNISTFYKRSMQQSHIFLSELQPISEENNKQTSNICRETLTTVSFQ